ncbi:hypothetical protein [Paraburkholderia sp.]|uniref:hypothetical protein n=1 Tax=Paraburkholderia sp. TaxID=1926495 RepID=UPI0039E62B43
MASSNLRTRIEQLERRQPPQDSVSLIVITALGDPENRPHLFARLGRGQFGPFKAVPEGATLEGLNACIAESRHGDLK